jgi:hypothetical protein
MRRLDDGWATNRGYEEDETGQRPGSRSMCSLEEKNDKRLFPAVEDVDGLDCDARGSHQARSTENQGNFPSYGAKHGLWSNMFPDS